MKQKKLMLLGGIRYLLPVIESAIAEDEKKDKFEVRDES